MPTATDLSKAFARRTLHRATITRPKVELPAGPPPEGEARPRFDPPADLVHAEPCGCRVTFFGDTMHRSSRIVPCATHQGDGQKAARDSIVGRARAKRGSL